jgi:hypothetical protein
MARSLTVISLLFQSTTLPLSSVYQISPDIHCHLPEKSQSSTAGNNGAPTSVPLSLGHALYIYIYAFYFSPHAYGCFIFEVRHLDLRNQFVSKINILKSHVYVKSISFVIEMLFSLKMKRNFECHQFYR